MDTPDINTILSVAEYQWALICSVAMLVLSIISTCILFYKAGEPPWKAIIPLYGSYTEYKIVMGNGWLFLLLLVPIVNIVLSIIFTFKLAKAYSRGTGFGFGLLFMPLIFRLILAFSDSEYIGPQ